MSKETLGQSIERLNQLGVRISVGPPEESAWEIHLDHIAPFNTPQGKRRPGKGVIIGPVKAGSYGVPPAELPPWGQMDDSLIADILPPIPLDWRLTDAEWWTWLTKIIYKIDSLIWPKYTPGAWTPARVGPILDADFELLAELRSNMGLPIESVFPTIVQHGDLFADEDNRNIAFGTGYERYDPTLPKLVSQAFTTVLTAGIVDKVGSLDLLLKLVFQRPRAYQVAVLQNRDGFTYQSAATANTPSLVSGHCLQGSIAGCTIFAAFRADLNDTSVDTLQHFTVDVGDRRVFAGVHYPSDNLSSWYTALKLLPHVFKQEEGVPDIKAFLWEAIDTKSAVFAAIKDHIDANPGTSPYEGAVDAIRAAAGS